MGERAYGYVRIETGDELSKRAKFALITWVGDEVPPLKKAKVSTDKASVKQTIQVMNLVFLEFSRSWVSRSYVLARQIFPYPLFFFNVARVIYTPFLDVLFTAIMFRLSRGFFCAFLVR